MGEVNDVRFKSFSALPEVDACGDTIQYLRRAQRLVKAHCKQDFWYSALATARLVDGNAKNVIQLPVRCYSITAVTMDSGDIYDYVKLEHSNNFTLLRYDAGSSYDEVSIGDVLVTKTGKFFTKGVENLSITGNWGWASCPDDVEDATYLVAEKLVLKDANSHQKSIASPYTSEKFDDYSYSKKQDGSTIDYVKDDAEVMALLRDYEWGIGIV